MKQSVDQIISKAKRFLNKGDYLETELDKSLKRLGIECVDLFYVHRRDTNIEIEEVTESLSRLVKKGGKIIYMVCSFFHSETIAILENFLKDNRNFSIEKFVINDEFAKIDRLISSDGYFLTIPTKYKKYNIDGFFSVKLIKND